MLTERLSTFTRRLPPPRRSGSDGDRFSEIWRGKQLEYAWMLSAAGALRGFLDA